MTIEEQMRALAVQFNVEPTDFLSKIARAREVLKIGIDICPCDAKDLDRGCISAKCLREIKEEGICHCHAFKKKEEK